MNRREKLIDNYEDALFAVLMDKVAEEEGAKLREENQRLKEDPSAEVPEHVDAVARQTIRKAYASQDRRSALHVARRVLNTVAVLVLICSALFATAYAAFPDVRVQTLNLLIQSSNVASKLSLVTGEEKNSDFEQSPGSITLCGYSIPDLRSIDFAIVDQGEDKHGGWIKFENNRGEIVRIDIAKGDAEYVDTESTENTKELDIHGYQGLLIVKDNRITIAWSESDHEAHISIIFLNLNRGFAIQTAENILFTIK